MTEPSVPSPEPEGTHRRAWDRLCWVVAGTASDEDRRLVDSHVGDCEECSAELAFQHRIRAGLLEGAAAPHDAEPALRRLMARIDAGDARVDLPSATTLASARPAVTRWLAAAVIVQAIGIAAASTALWQRTDRGAGYRTLSGDASPPAAARVRLVPAADMDFAALQSLLARHRLAVVEASADGRSFGLATVDGTSPETGDLLQRLRGEPGVRMAEPIAR